MIALIATLGLTLLAFALLGGIAFVVRGQRSGVRPFGWWEDAWT